MAASTALADNKLVLKYGKDENEKDIPAATFHDVDILASEKQIYDTAMAIGTIQDKPIKEVLNVTKYNLFGV